MDLLFEIGRGNGNEEKSGATERSGAISEFPGPGLRYNFIGE